MDKVRDINCRCGQFLCQRQANEIIYHSLRIPLSRPVPIVCPACSYVTDIKRHRKKNIDKTEKETTILAN